MKTRLTAVKQRHTVRAIDLGQALGHERGSYVMAGTQQVDSQTLRNTGATFTTSAGSVGDVIGSVTSSIGALIWTGGIAEQFNADFADKYKPMLEQLQADMEATSKALEDKAAEYDLVFHGAV